MSVWFMNSECDPVQEEYIAFSSPNPTPYSHVLFNNMRAQSFIVPRRRCRRYITRPRWIAGFSIIQAFLHNSYWIELIFFSPLESGGTFVFDGWRDGTNLVFSANAKYYQVKLYYCERDKINVLKWFVVLPQIHMV